MAGLTSTTPSITTLCYDYNPPNCCFRNSRRGGEWVNFNEHLKQVGRVCLSNDQSSARQKICDGNIVEIYT